MRVDDI